MKKVICIVLVLLVSSMIAVAYAETDISSMTDEELYALRLQINQELADRNKTATIPDGATIADLFPDPVLAKYVRDEVGAFTVDTVVTQEKLDKVQKISFTNTDSGIKSLEGIGYLHGMWQLILHNQDHLINVPEEIGNCISLKRIMLSCKNVTAIPDSICNLPLLNYLDLSYSSISELPADIGNLANLKDLDISHTKITSLPESIYSLELDTFKRSGLDLD